MLTYYNWKENKREEITIEDIVKILNRSKRINISKKDPLPEGQVTFVGVGNDKYECKTLWDMKYTDHMKDTYGGYFKEDHSGYNAWWTMNYNYSDKYDKSIMYIVNTEEDGEKLAAFLNFIERFENIDLQITRRVMQIKDLQNEINFLGKFKDEITKNMPH